MRTVVGFSQKTKRVWLDALLDKLVHTTDEADLRKFLEKYLKDDLPGKASRAKSAGILLRIWSSVPPEQISLRDRAVAMLPRISGQERIWLHWGMSALAYPFFRDTAEVVGRLLSLQDDFTTGQVQARMLTTWGDRATTREAAQKLLNTLVDWEVLRPTKVKGHFLLSRKMSACIPDLQLWLLEALLAASAADEIEAQQLLRLPESFPFTISIGVTDLRRYEGFNIHRQGLDMDMVATRRLKAEPPPKPSTKTKTTKKRVERTLFEMEADDTSCFRGKPNDKPVTAPTETEPDQPDTSAERQRIEDSIRNELLGTLSDRAKRFLQVRGAFLVPNGPFAAPSGECIRLFRDGHYYGCIALTQAVIEAVIRHIWQIRVKKKPSQEGAFLRNVEDLHKMKIVSSAWKLQLCDMWTERNSFHHLRPSVETDEKQLEDIAERTLKLLSTLEQQFFGFQIQDGMLIPTHPEYWMIRNGEALVVARGVRAK